MTSLTLGIDLGGTKILGAAVDEAGHIVNRAGAPTVDGDLAGGAIDTVDKVSKAASGEINAIGLAVAAYVKQPEGIPKFAPNLHGDIDIADEIRKKFGLPVIVENDANAATWGEFVCGAGREVSDMLMLTIGTGVGGGIVIDGALYRGRRGFAGEFGHMTVVDGGPVCACGLEGCLEAVASGSAIARLAKEALTGGRVSSLIELSQGQPGRINGSMVADAASAGDEVSVDVLRRVGRALGIGLANLVNIFDPSLIVIGGGAAEAGEPLLGPAIEEAKARLANRGGAPDIVSAYLGNDAGVIGAALLARTAAA